MEVKIFFPKVLLFILFIILIITIGKVIVEVSNLHHYKRDNYCGLVSELISDAEKFNSIVKVFLQEMQKAPHEENDLRYLEMLRDLRQCQNEIMKLTDYEKFYVTLKFSNMITAISKLKWFVYCFKTYKLKMIENMNAKEDLLLGMEHIATDQSFISNVNNQRKTLNTLKVPWFRVAWKK